MKMTTGHPLYSKVQLIDVMGKVIDGVSSFDTQSSEAQLYLRTGQKNYVVTQKTNGSGNEAKQVVTALKGAKLVWKDNLKELTLDEFLNALIEKN